MVSTADINTDLLFWCRRVPAGHPGYGSSATHRLEQLRDGGILQYGADLCFPPDAERLQPAGLHQLRGRISWLPGLHLHSARYHAGADTGFSYSINA